MRPLRWPDARARVSPRSRGAGLAPRGRLADRGSGLLDAFDSGWVSGHGEYVTRVERDFPPLVGAAAGVPCASGTAALHLALLALDVRAGDEVIVPNLGYVATANAPLYVGATPVLADVRAGDWTVDPAEVRTLITPRTRGVIAVHLFGVVSDLTALRALCDRLGLWLVEDCAQALGAPAGPCGPGAWGELATWSFYGNKVLTSGEGGFVTSRTRADLVAVADAYRRQAVADDDRYAHRQLGFNYRITNLQCALLCAQMSSLERFRDARAAIHDAYEAELAPAIDAGLLLPTPCPDVCWLHAVLLDASRVQRSRDAIVGRLRAEHGIEARPFPRAMRSLPHLRDVPAGPQPVSSRLARTGLNLPTYVGLEANDVRVIARALAACLREAAAA